MGKFGWAVTRNGQKIDSTQRHEFKVNMVIIFGNAHVVLDSVTITVYIFSHSCLLPKKTKFLYQVFLPAKAGSHCI